MSTGVRASSSCWRGLTSLPISHVQAPADVRNISTLDMFTSSSLCRDLFRVCCERSSIGSMDWQQCPPCLIRACDFLWLAWTSLIIICRCPPCPPRFGQVFACRPRCNHCKRAQIPLCGRHAFCHTCITKTLIITCCVSWTGDTEVRAEGTNLPIDHEWGHVRSHRRQSPDSPAFDLLSICPT